MDDWSDDGIEDSLFNIISYDYGDVSNQDYATNEKSEQTQSDVVNPIQNQENSTNDKSEQTQGVKNPIQNLEWTSEQSPSNVDDPTQKNFEEHEGVMWSIEDEIPLIRFKKRRCTRKIFDIESDGDYDISDDGDDTYQPLSASESNDSVSEDEILTKAGKANVPKINVAAKQSYDEQILHVKSLSKQEASLKDLIRKTHLTRLDNILATNELYRCNVYPDGNCLFASVLLSLGKSCEKIDVDKYRNTTCDHLLAKKLNYLDYMTELEHADYELNIEHLRNTGVWDISLGDILPLAVANMSTCTLQIYSSSRLTPVYEIKPSLVTPLPGEKSKIFLAYTVIEGEEHYDAALPINKSKAYKANTDTEELIYKTTPCVNTCNDRFSEIHVTSKEKPNERRNNIGGTSQEDSPADKSNLTPHKRAAYKSPDKKKSCRKKSANPNSWKRYNIKNKRLSGEEYITTAKKTKAARSVKPVDCSTCRYHCQENISEDLRRQIFGQYYSLGSFIRQKDFICSMVDSKAPIRTNGNKKVSLAYHFVNDNHRYRVCKPFFEKTLDISNTSIKTAMKEKKNGVFAGKDRRGQQPSVNRTKEDDINVVRKHIESFPKVESHYCRKDTKREILSQDLSIRKMWHLYKEQLEGKQQTYVKEAQYRKIFCKEYNLSFFHPKKDQCSTCHVYKTKNCSGNLDKATEEKYKKHQERKIMAREEKAKDKMKAETDPHYRVYTFDLQAVLSTPCSKIGEMYYSRKLASYNLTFYSLGDGQGTCHTWDETQAKRGSNEVATALIRQTSSVCTAEKRVTTIIYYSDACGGQNRNQYVAASLLYCLAKNPQLDSIQQKFLESGHSQMECDSMHSTIETAKRKTEVFVPSQWTTVIKMARRKNPYLVSPIKYSDVYNVKDFAKQCCPNMQITTHNAKVSWLKIRWILVKREDPNSIFIGYDFDETHLQEVRVQVKTRKGRNNDIAKYNMDYCYQTKQPITLDKKKDLLKLCKKNIIPEEYHDYYNQLKTGSQVVDSDSDSELD